MSNGRALRTILLGQGGSSFALRRSARSPWAGQFVLPVPVYDETIMAETTYNDPKFALSRIYTKQGDQGETSLVNGRRVAKDDPRIEAYGTVDELNSLIGAARVSAQELASQVADFGGLAEILLRVQHELFNLGSILATDPGDPKQPRVGAADVRQLENEIDSMNASSREWRADPENEIHVPSSKRCGPSSCRVDAGSTSSFTSAARSAGGPSATASPSSTASRFPTKPFNTSTA